MDKTKGSRRLTLGLCKKAIYAKQIRIIMNSTNHYKLYRVAAVLWMAIIFFLSSQSHLSIPGIIPYTDKFAHAITFGILGILFACSFKTTPENRYALIRRIIFITIMVTIYGASDETHQMFVEGRTASVADLTADTIGGLTSVSIFYMLHKTNHINV